MFAQNFGDVLNPYDDFLAEFNFTDTWNPNNPDVFSLVPDYQNSDWSCFKSKPQDTWSVNDILYHLCNEATNNNRNYEDFKLYNFVNITSDQFKNLSLDECIRRCESSEDGRLFYESKEQLFRQHHSDCATNQNLNGTQPHKDLLSSACHEERPPRWSCSSSESSTFELPPVRRGPGRPRSSHAVRRKPEKRMGKLWEFLRNLLLDHKTCPSLIKWDNFDEGTFKFVQSDKVAKLWGDRKKNDKMNYEKLSRAMRYYYRSKVLLPVAGKRLVYQFGPQAKGWKTDNPILEKQVEVHS